MVTKLEDYFENFNRIKSDQWALDASTDYFWCESTPFKLKDFAENCDLRIIAIIRDPVDRAVSEYNHTLRHNWEPLSFAESISAEPLRRRNGWHPLFYHLRRSCVRSDLHQFFSVFGDDILILDYRQLENISLFTRRICELLKIREFNFPNFERKNETILPRSNFILNIVKNKKFRYVVHKLSSDRARQIVWKSLHTNSKNVQTVSESEKSHFRRALKHEIEECLRDPLIPTDNWRTAVQEK